MSFQETGYQLVNDVLSKDTANLLATYMEVYKKRYMFLNKINHPDTEDNPFYNPDPQVMEAFCVRSTAILDSLLLQVMPKVENVVGKKLLPTYSFARIYYKYATLHRHIDKPTCQYSTTLTLSSDEHLWEIWFKDKTGNETAIDVPVGSMCVYMGEELEHWREPYMGNKQVQVFLHYVDAESEYAKYKYEGRPVLGLY